MNAILYLKAAWVNRDSLAADTVYADNYVGTSSESGVQLPPFAKTDEIQALAGVEKDPTVTGVIVDFKDPINWTYTAYSSDPPSWVAYSIFQPRISVFTTTDEQRADASTFFEFKMQPQVVAPGDTLWQIIRWTESQ